LFTGGGGSDTLQKKRCRLNVKKNETHTKRFLGSPGNTPSTLLCAAYQFNMAAGVHNAVLPVTLAKSIFGKLLTKIIR
jgi:hypothetical protein